MKCRLLTMAHCLLFVLPSFSQTSIDLNQNFSPIIYQGETSECFGYAVSSVIDFYLRVKKQIGIEQFISPGITFYQLHEGNSFCFERMIAMSKVYHPIVVPEVNLTKLQNKPTCLVDNNSNIDYSKKIFIKKFQCVEKDFRNSNNGPILTKEMAKHFLNKGLPIIALMDTNQTRINDHQFLEYYTDDNSNGHAMVISGGVFDDIAENSNSYYVRDSYVPNKSRGYLKVLMENIEKHLI